MMWLRHLLAIAILPFSVAVLVPLWIARRNDVEPALGLGFFTASLHRFASKGHGTLAPWDPPRELVVRGPYRYVRNPMISGVVLALFGESLVLLSLAHATWAGFFLALNLVYIPLFEEPQLARRFRAAYAEYCRHVPRVVPRLRPWSGRSGC